MWLAVLWLLRLLLLAGLTAFLWRVVDATWQGVSAVDSIPRGRATAADDRAKLRVIKTREDCAVFASATGYRLSNDDEVNFERELEIGRGEENGLVLQDGFVSNRHARVLASGDGWWVEDLGSRNGTLVNGRRIRGRRRLSSGDQLTVGCTSFRFTG